MAWYKLNKLFVSCINIAGYLNQEIYIIVAWISVFHISRGNRELFFHKMEPMFYLIKGIIYFHFKFHTNRFRSGSVKVITFIFIILVWLQMYLGFLLWKNNFKNIEISLSNNCGKSVSKRIIPLLVFNSNEYDDQLPDIRVNDRSEIIEKKLNNF